MDFIVRHWPGFLIIGLSILTAVPLLVWRWVSWKKRAPKLYHRGIGIIYKPGAVEPWDGINEAIDAVLDQLPHEPLLRDKISKFSDFWIEIHPWSGALLSQFMPTGFIDENGRAVPQPKEWDGKVARATGTMGGDRAFPVTKYHHIVMTRQKPRGATQEDNFWGRSNGNPPVSAGESTIHHEYAEHLVSMLLKRGVNSGHTDEELKQLKQRIRERYNTLRKGTT